MMGMASIANTICIAIAIDWIISTRQHVLVCVSV